MMIMGLERISILPMRPFMVKVSLILPIFPLKDLGKNTA